MISARSDQAISPAHAPHLNSVPTIIAIAIVSSVIAIVLFYAVASCYASRPSTSNTLSTGRTTLSVYSTHSELEHGGWLSEKGVLGNNWSQEFLVKAPERAHTMDGNDIPFWEPRAPPVCTKIAASNPKLSPVEGARLGFMHMADTTWAREKEMKISKKGSWMRLAT